jgi:hypothetical protein
MTLANPLALLWLLLAVPLVWLWLRKPALLRETVATSALWQEALAVEQLRAGWQRWRRGASLAIRLLILLLLVLALADPRTRPPQRLVLVLDNSASMNATDVTPSRLAAAMQAAQEIIDSLHDDDRAAIVTAGEPAAVRCGLTGDKAALSATLEDVCGRTTATDMAAAVDLARRLLPEGSGSRIVLLTDGCFPDAAELARRDSVSLVSFGTRAGNVAITRLAARSCAPAVPTATEMGGTGAPPVSNEAKTPTANLCQVLVEVRSFCDRTVKCRLKIESKQQTIDLPPDGRWQEVWEVPLPPGRPITARLDSANDPAAIREEWAEVEVNPEPKASPGRKPGDREVSGHAASSPGLRPRLALGSGLAMQELDLRVPANLGGESATAVVPPGSPPIWLFLLAAGGLLICAEWCLVQRRWMG